jgi:hypothetical protein
VLTEGEHGPAAQRAPGHRTGVDDDDVHLLVGAPGEKRFCS